MRVADLTVVSHRVADTLFEDCLILGPAVIIFSGEGAISNCSFDGPPEAILWQISPEREEIIGAVEFANCSFNGCRFQGIGLAGNKDFVDQFGAGLIDEAQSGAEVGGR